MEWQERKAIFAQMLEDRGVASFGTWEKQLPKFVTDPRYKILPKIADRRKVFDHFVRHRAKEVCACLLIGVLASLLVESRVALAVDAEKECRQSYSEHSTQGEAHGRTVG